MLGSVLWACSEVEHAAREGVVAGQHKGMGLGQGMTVRGVAQDPLPPATHSLTITSHQVMTSSVG